MTARDPRDGYEEVSFGTDARPGSPRRLLIGVAATCLAVGFLAGAAADDVRTRAAASDPSSSVLPVAAGGVARVANAAHGADLQLPVFNASQDEIEVSVLDLDGWGSGALSSPVTRIAPGTWQKVRFTAPADCADPLPENVRFVGLQATTSDDQYEQDVPISDDQALIEYHNAACAQSDPVLPSEWTGVWTIERAYGPTSWLEGTALMRFERDGTFAVGAEGTLFARPPAFWGHYRLHGGLLTWRVQGRGDSCGRDATTTGRLASRGDGTFSLAWLRGECPPPNGDVWILRRVLLNLGLPPAPVIRLDD